MFHVIFFNGLFKVNLEFSFSFPGFSFSGLDLPLRRPKRLIFLEQGPEQGPREEVQGPCARAIRLVNRNRCKGDLDMCKGHIFCGP